MDLYSDYYNYLNNEKNNRAVDTQNENDPEMSMVDAAQQQNNFSSNTNQHPSIIQENKINFSILMNANYDNTISSSSTIINHNNNHSPDGSSGSSSSSSRRTSPMLDGDSSNSGNNNNNYNSPSMMSKQNQKENANAANNKDNKSSTFPFGNCKVCLDKATGIHYGVR
jgi:hypothetical protein